jgi:hypothetical protein
MVTLISRLIIPEHFLQQSTTEFSILSFISSYIYNLSKSHKVHITRTSTSSLYWLERQSLFLYVHPPTPFCRVTSNARIPTSSSKHFFYRLTTEFSILSFISSNKSEFCLEHNEKLKWIEKENENWENAAENFLQGMREKLQTCTDKN